jgi:hypothetical protein
MKATESRCSGASTFSSLSLASSLVLGEETRRRDIVVMLSDGEAMSVESVPEGR